ncbi:hypothetical protein C772_00900 [Bhargavaea cecembensis DSE10]|uniref:Uncharacterized protein n=1 Tax=Bhargavaea cecembensis DSE10 TaxID=1235279 RepID=M7P031_9BACL|nr:hypothetical protein [Bhargavaea cecembensis]EMR07255.1 hypothetical protein C772_00900 [Bhargavaea cecembensis DSE10]
MKQKWILHGIGAGIISGMLLGAFLWAVEEQSGHSVYTLLMNVDYIPVVNAFTYPAPVEFLFHLIVSVILATVLLWLVRRMRMLGNRVIVWLVTVNTLIGALIWPVTSLSDRTPAPGDWASFAWWLAGHALYGAVLGWLLQEKD